jgi:CPA2 family monovalent cation:H+ antiporter-2
VEPGNFVLEIVLVLAAATVGAAVFERFRLPAIAGFLVMGGIVGPGGLRLVAEPERVAALAELGVALLLFEIGLEIPIGMLRREWRAVSISGALQVLLTVAGVAVVAAALGVRVESAIVVGMLISLSSTAFAMRILSQRGEIGTPHGQISVGILLFQDLCLVPFLLAIPILSGEVGGEGSSLAFALGRAFAALVVLLAVARFVLPWVLERIARLRSPDLFSLFTFLMAIGSAVAAEAMGLTLAVGAFVAGLVVSASPYSHQLFTEIVPLRGVLLGIFFTAVGMLFDPVAAFAVWDGILLFVAGVVVLKAGIIAIVVGWVLRRGTRIGLLTGLGLAQTGEFSFVLAAAAEPAGLLDASLRQVFVAGSVLTLLATPFLVRLAPTLATFVSGGLDRIDRHPSAVGDTLEGHVIVVGFGRAWQTLARVLAASQIPYRVVDQNAQTVAEAARRGEPISFGDATRVPILDRLRVRHARLVAIVTNDPGATRRCIAMVRGMAPDVRIVARARYVREIDGLITAGASEVVAEEFESAIDLFSRVLASFEIGQQAITQFAEAMRMEGYEFMRDTAALPIDPWLSEVLDEVSNEWVEVPEGGWGERRIFDLEVRARTGASIVAVRRAGETASNPSPEFAIRPGDALLVMAGRPRPQSIGSTVCLFRRSPWYRVDVSVAAPESCLPAMWSSPATTPSLQSQRCVGA